jgi:peptidoglycan/xylan/chitin deacetylase (PgdA/CDA1 family)
MTLLKGVTRALSFAVALLIALIPLVSLGKTNDFEVLCYHDVSKTRPGDAYGVTLTQLEEQFEFLHKNYSVVSLDDVLLASQGKKTLPAKAVLITFDDGLSSFYELVYPLLKRYKFPAVFAVVGKWIDDGKAPDYGYVGVNPPMTTWAQLKEMSDSGLVAVVSHTYDLHHGHIFNPQGNEQAYAGFLNFNLSSKSYETESDFFNRIKTDLAENEKLLKKHIGKTYPIIVWPYGTYNGLSQKAATELGLPIQFSVEMGLNNTSNLNLVRRTMVLSHFSLADIEKGLKTSFAFEAPIKAVTIDLDSLWVPSEDESNIHLGNLNYKAAQVRPNLAVIQTFSAQGEAYFPTSQFPVKANFFGRVAHVLQNRARVERVYANIPLQYLKDETNTQRLVHDLAIYNDIDGIFFDARGNSAKKMEKLIPLAMKTGDEIRPFWSYGFIGSRSPKSPDGFKYIIQSKFSKSLHKLEDSKNPIMIASLDSKKVQSIPETFKKLSGLGIKNFFLPLSFNSYSDLQFLKTNFHSASNPYTLPMDDVK